MAKVNLTAGRIANLECPPDKSQAFLWDTDTPGLGVRKTRNGKPAFVFQRSNGGRVVIGGISAWSISKAREKAREMQREIDQGLHPAREKAKRKAELKAAEQELRNNAITVREAWLDYLKNGRPRKKDAFSPRYRSDLESMASPGGEKKKRGKGLTLPGPLFELLCLPLGSLDEERLLVWHREQAVRGRAQAARALMMLRGFLGWCELQPEYRLLAKAPSEAASAKSITGQLPSIKRRRDVIEPSQVATWWRAVEALPNPVISAYLRALLLTGVRREAMASLKWSDIDLRWGTAKFSDKVDGTRVTPLGKRMLSLLKSLPKQGEYVFPSDGKKGYVQDPRASMKNVLTAAGMPHVTIHGIRRSFALLTEDAGIPLGAAHQLMGHRVNNVHEGYKPRSLDQIRTYINRLDEHLQSAIRLPAISPKDDVSTRSVT